MSIRQQLKAWAGIEPAASRAEPPETVAAAIKRGRKAVVTPERLQLICELLAHGESEHSACIRAGIGLTANRLDGLERGKTIRCKLAGAH